MIEFFDFFYILKSHELNPPSTRKKHSLELNLSPGILIRIA